MLSFTLLIVAVTFRAAAMPGYHVLLPMPARRLLSLHGPVKKKRNDPFSNLPRIEVYTVSAETEQVMDEAQDK